jgi:hypothetical protein
MRQEVGGDKKSGEIVKGTGGKEKRETWKGIKQGSRK